MINDYKIVCQNSWVDLSAEVNKQIKQGWQPLGRPIVASSAWHQTMVRFDKKPEHGSNDY